jgi:hypothetical protein
MGVRDPCLSSDKVSVSNSLRWAQIDGREVERRAAAAEGGGGGTMCRWREAACSRLASMVAMTPNNLVRVSEFERGGGGCFPPAIKKVEGGPTLGWRRGDSGITSIVGFI